MKIRTIILVAIVVLLLVNSVTWAQSSGSPGDVVQQAMISGNRYHLASAAWQARGIASGGEYRLASPVVPGLRGSGCCCTYLPCMLRQLP